MSTYEDYAKTSAYYDATRVAVGSDLVLGAIAGSGVTLADAHVLDAGCGTGNYAVAVAPHVRALTLVDASAGMRSEAEAKLAQLRTTFGDLQVEVREGVLPDLPFDEGAFDAVMINQVLHHVGDTDGASWDNTRAAVRELARVVRPGGALVVNTTSRVQLREGYWYFDLIPGAVDALRRRYAPLDVLEAAMVDAGLEPAGRYVPIGEPIQGSSYSDGRSALDEGWRNGDSTWALASETELAAAIEQARSLEASGELDAYVDEHDHVDEVGQVTFVVAHRP